MENKRKKELGRTRVRNVCLRAPNGRPTIGYLAPAIHGDSQAQWVGVVDAAQKHNVNLICFPGSSIHIPIAFWKQSNILYDLVTTKIVDGIVSWASSIGNYTNAKEISIFHERYRPLPIVTIGRILEGFPGLLMDSYEGMREALIHLIEVHGYHRIAFIRGPEDHFYAQERYRAYTDTLRAYNLPFDPDLVTPPFSWEPSMGMEAMRLLLDEHKLRPRVDFEAVVAANDHMLLGALEILQARGIYVPGEVAIVGFDDIGLGRTSIPPFTSVRVPYYEVGYQAVETVLALIEGQSFPEKTVIPSKLVVRQSCGCFNPTVLQAAVDQIEGTTLSFEVTFAMQREKILDTMRHALEVPPEGLAPDWAEHLLDAFSTALNQETPGLFLRAFDDVLRQVIAAAANPSTVAFSPELGEESGQDVTGWQNVVSAMERQVLPCFGNNETGARHQAENLWRQIRVMIGEAAQRAKTAQILYADQHAQTLREIEAALITTFDVKGLMDVLAKELPRLYVPGCYLAVYEDPQPYEYPQPAPEWSRLILAYNDQERVAMPPEGQRFPSHCLVPDGLLSWQSRYRLVVEPLYFQEYQIGFVIFKIGPGEGNVYEILRGEISSALQGDLLVQQVQEHAAEIVRHQNHLEDLVEERTAELTRSNTRLHEEIVERKRVEYALRVSEQQYRLLAENMMDGIVIVQEGKLVFANAAFAAMVRHPLDHLLGVDLVTLFPDHAQRTPHVQFTRSNHKTTEPQWQVEMMTGDGQRIWTEIEQTAMMWDNRPAILLTIRNITQRKLREIQLEQERTRLQQENLTFKSMSFDRYRFGPLVGKSPAMQRVYELIVSAATSDVNVLLIGESGTGKELIARTLHQVSTRKGQAFVPVNCASIPETLFEREFFGHRKGAFTGADRDKPGLFDRAHKGTLFLDEVTELSPGTQAKLLRVLQDGEYTPLGSNTPKQANVLIIAATNEDCRVEIKQGRLRKDFFYRIGVIELAVPPLRERKEDLPLLIEYILEQYRQKQLTVHGNIPSDLPTDQTMLPGTLVQEFYAYDWPGNVRELQNVLQRYLATRDLAFVFSLLKVQIPGRTVSSHPPIPSHLSLPEAVKAFEKQRIAGMFALNRYDVRKTAEMLGLPLRTLYHKLNIYQLKESN